MSSTSSSLHAAAQLVASQFARTIRTVEDAPGGPAGPAGPVSPGAPGGPSGPGSPFAASGAFPQPARLTATAIAISARYNGTPFGQWWIGSHLDWTQNDASPFLW